MSYAIGGVQYVATGGQSRTEGPISARHARASCHSNCAAVAST